MALITFTDKAFHELSLEEWYAISNLRERVFVVEQNCPFLDADNKDQRGYHIIGQDSQSRILAYARIVHPMDEFVPWSKLEYHEGLLKESKSLDSNRNKLGIHLPAIGRVVLDKSVRGKGWADVLLKYSLACYLRNFKTIPVFISAQEPLRSFYNQHGFVQSGKGYLEDGIPHIPMVNGFDL